MIRNAILGIAAVAVLGATAAIFIGAPTTASAGHYSQGINKPAYVKGSILRHCLDNQGECALIVH